MLAQLFVSLFYFVWALVSGASNQNHASFVEGIIVSKSLENVGKVTFDKLPTEKDSLSIIPAYSKTSYRMKINCYELRSGYLKRCSFIEKFPENINDRIIIKKFVDKIRVDKRSRQAFGDSAFIELNIHIRDNSRKLDESCPSGWCASPPSLQNGGGLLHPHQFQ